MCVQWEKCGIQTHVKIIKVHKENWNAMKKH